MSQILSNHKKSRNKDYKYANQNNIKKINKKCEINPNEKTNEVNWPYDEAWDCQDTISDDESYEPSAEEIAECENLKDLNDLWEISEDELEIEDLPINYLNDEIDEW